MKRHHHRVNISKRELGSFSWRPYSLLSSVFASHGREGGEIYSHCVCASPVSSPPSLYTITYNKRTPRDTTTFTSSIQHFALLLLLLWACGELLLSFHSLLFVFLFCCFFSGNHHSKLNLSTLQQLLRSWRKENKRAQRLKSLSCRLPWFQKRWWRRVSLHWRMRRTLFVFWLTIYCVCMLAGFFHLVYHHPVSFIRNYVDAACILTLTRFF